MIGGDRAVNGRVASLALLVGGLAIVVGAAIAGKSGLLETVVGPPALVRAFLVAAMTLVAIALGRASLARFVAAGAIHGGLAESDPIVMLRGIRLAFLSLAALAAAAGWLLSSPLPLVVAGIVAAVDVAETSFLLLVVGPLQARRPRAGVPPEPPGVYRARHRSRATHPAGRAVAPGEAIVPSEASGRGTSHGPPAGS